MNKNLLFISYILLIILTASSLTAQKKKGEIANLKNISGAPSLAYLSINNIATPFYSNGRSDITLGGDSGFEYPKGSNKTVFFQSGPLWGGSIDGYWAVGGSAYRSGLQPGRILPDGTAEDQTLASVRIYRVRSDYKNFTGDDGKKVLFADEMAVEGKTADEIYAQYELDWKQWPAKYGAPYIDKDSDGVYNPDKDVPGMSENQCQTIWFVANDLDAAVTQYMYGALPMKIEMQGTFWAFKGNKPEGNVIYRRYKLINRNSKTIDSMSICMWSDPDLGGAFDDLCGCDTTMNLGYVYNKDGDDDVYGTSVPAAGFVMLQSPYINGSEQNAAEVDLRSKTGYKNLGMTVFFIHSNNYPADWSDPLQGSYKGALSFKNWFQGKTSISGVPFTDPTTGKTTKYCLSGDPVSGTGWLDATGNDRRFGLVSGSFTMNPNDTQQMIVAQIAAGGENNINNTDAVSVLKYYSKSVNQSWKSSFNKSQPVSPTAAVSELDGQLILSWSDSSSIAKCEKDLNSVYKFQGYNVYQFPKSTSLLAEGTRIATYDIVDNLLAISGWVEDASTGYIENRVIGFGSNSGIKRYLTVNQDVIDYKKPFYNYSKYYFGVTAYYVADDREAVPRLIESPVQIITAVPQPAIPGVVYNSAIGEKVTTVHSEGSGTGSITLQVFDPTKVTGHNYQLRFEKFSLTDTTSVNKWFVKDLITGKDVLYNQTVYGGIDAITGAKSGASLSNADGINFNVTGSTSVSQNFMDVTLNGTSLPAGGAHWLGSGYTICQGSYWGYRGTTVRYGSLTANRGHGSTDPLLLKNDFELQFTGVSETKTIHGLQTEVITSGGSYVTFAGAVNYDLKDHPLNPKYGVSSEPFLVRVPFEIWDVEKNQQITCIIQDGGGKLTDAIVRAWQIGERNYVDVLNLPYNATAVYNPATGDTGWMEKLTYFFGTYKCSWTKGDEIRFEIDNPLTTEDMFTFTGPSVTNSTDLAKEDINKINVFPNPYYGVNAQEGSSYQRFVTFTHLPQRANIKIFNLAGQIVRKIEKDDAGQTLRWNLATDSNFFIASGIYVAHIELPDLGKTKILKFAVIVEQQYPYHY